MKVVDASALLALLAGEPGAERVQAALAGGAVVSAVNLSEVAAKLGDWGMPEEDVREAIGGLGVPVIGFDEDQAYIGGGLRKSTRQAGLSLGDRSCLALALQQQVPVLTADRSWQDLALDVAVELVRE